MNRDPEAFKGHVRRVLAGQERGVLADPSLTCAAVLIPLLRKAGVWHVLVTQRTQNVEHHKGQISLPGGACEPQDASLQETALRETHEEIGIPPERVKVLGVLDDFPTISDFVVTPFVGVVPHPFDYRLNPHEVDGVVELPLDFLLEPKHLRVEYWEHEGRPHEVLFWDYGSHTIWGLTARILHRFLSLVFNE